MPEQDNTAHIPAPGYIDPAGFDAEKLAQLEPRFREIEAEAQARIAGRDVASSAADLIGWAIVELMGRVKIAGKVSEATIAGATMLRIDYAVGNRNVTRYFSAGSIYSITPVERVVVERFVNHSEPVALYELSPIRDFYGAGSMEKPQGFPGSLVDIGSPGGMAGSEYEGPELWLDEGDERGD